MTAKKRLTFDEGPVGSLADLAEEGAVFDCIIPAAGASSRMGAWKPGLAFRGGTLLSAAAARALESGCRVIAVAGRAADSVPGALGGLADRVEIVPNPAWEEGMTGSLQAGMARVSSPFFFVLPADMPFVPSRAFRLLAREAEVRAAAGLPESSVFPVFRGEPGHPVLIPSSLIPEALRLPRDARFKDFLAVRGPVFVEVGDPGILTDLDTRSEYEGALRLVSRSS